ncbi:IS66 family insertion sequence element accessory protein TnpB (plasmid) [Verrucomicrobiaceae bacterium 227]|tara:strand:+ start:483 stop:836 length:354 start_codon:yes stop_codon:yes gene_type:complete
MILTHSVKVCLATQPCDLRKSFDTLSCVVEEQLKEDPLSSKLFVFLNKRADRVKMLYWDGTGLWILMKRLERGVFARPKSDDNTKAKIHLKPEALEMLLSGIDLKDGMQRAWYQDSK